MNFNISGILDLQERLLYLLNFPLIIGVCFCRLLHRKIARNFLYNAKDILPPVLHAAVFLLSPPPYNIVVRIATRRPGMCVEGWGAVRRQHDGKLEVFKDTTGFFLLIVLWSLYVHRRGHWLRVKKEIT